MNILIAVNKQYIRQAEVMLTSLRLSMPDEEIYVYLFYKNIAKESIEKFRSFLKKKNNIVLKDIIINDKLLQDLPLMAHYSVEIYYRLLVDSILPENIDRILWLDSDIVINKSIYKLYYTDFEDNYLAVCNDLFVGREQLLKYLDDEKIKNNKYFNSGVILFNLKKIRKDKKQKEIVNFLYYNKSKLDMPDQDALNVVYCGNVKYFDGFEFNHLINGREEINSKQAYIIKNKTAIIHFVGAEKPWFYKYINQSWKYYWKIEKKLGNYLRYYTFFTRHYLYVFARKMYYIVKK